jgi:acetoin utilization protein AcuB
VKLLTEHNINMLPVLEEGKLVGIISDRDVQRAAPSETTLIDVQQILYHLSRLEIGAIMTREPITVPDDFTLEETAEVFLDNNISGCPVMSRKGQIVGVITKNDLFKALISSTGMRRGGIRIGFLVEDKPGFIKDVTALIRRYDGRLANIMSTVEGTQRGYRSVYVRAYGLDRSKIGEILNEFRTKARLLYVIDHETGKRETFATPGELYV